MGGRLLKPDEVVVLEQLVRCGALNLDEVGEKTRQVLIDLGMCDPAMVEVLDGSEVGVTIKGRWALAYAVLAPCSRDDASHRAVAGPSGDAATVADLGAETGQ